MRHHLLAAVGLILAGLFVGCSEQPTDTGSVVSLDLEVVFGSDPGLANREAGGSEVITEISAQAFRYDEESNTLDLEDSDTDVIEPKDTSFSISLTVRPGSYSIQVEAQGLADGTTVSQGLLYEGSTFLEDVRAGSPNRATIVLLPIYPQFNETFATETDYRLSWGAISGALRYDLREINENEFETVYSLSRTDTTITFPPTLTFGGGERSYRVRAVFEDKVSAYSEREIVSLLPEVPPARTTDLRVGAFTDTTAVLHWTAPGDDGDVGQASRYDLRISDELIDTPTLFDQATPLPDLPLPSPAGTEETYLVTGLEASTLYNFALRTEDDVPITSSLSNPIAFTTLPPPDRTPPAQVTDLAAVEIGVDSFELEWTATGDDGNEGTATRYEARISTDPINDDNFASATSLPDVPTPSPPGSSEFLFVDGLDERTTYYVGLKVYDEEDNESPLATTELTTADGTGPSAVTDLTAVAESGTEIQLSFTAPNDGGRRVDTYEVRFSLAPLDESNFAEATRLTTSFPQAPGATEILRVINLTPETTYYFGQRSTDDQGNVSALSNIASATTPDVIPPIRTTDLAAEAIDQTTIRLTWTAPGDNGIEGTAASYDLRLSEILIDETNFEDATPIALGPPQPPLTQEAIEVSGLETGRTYFFRLRTTDDAGNVSDLSNSTFALPSDFIPPSAVTLSLESTSTNSVTLSWTAPGDDGTDGTAALYDLRYSDKPFTADEFFDAIRVLDLPTPSPSGSSEMFEVTGLEEATTYYFGLLSQDEAGNFSDVSNIVEAATGTAAPEAPSNLAAVAQSTTLVRLVWQDNADNETSYEIERRTEVPGAAAGGDFVRIATIGPANGGVTFDDDTATDRTTYTYRVRAVNAGGASAYSNEVTVRTPVPVPQDFEVTAQAYDEVLVEWSYPFGDPDGFRIERLEEGWTTVGEVMGSAREFLDTDLTYLTTYTYRMVATDAGDDSDHTEKLSVETPDEEPFCSISPSRLDFATLEPGQRDTLSVTFTNTGGGILTGTAVFNFDCAHFESLDPASFGLPRGQSKTVDIVYAPLSEGSHECDLLTGSLCASVPCTGSAVEPEDNYWWDGFGPNPSGQGVDGRIRAMEAGGDGFLYVGGEFSRVGPINSAYAARWNGGSWTSRGGSLNGTVRALHWLDGRIYAGGEFNTQGEPNHFAYWEDKIGRWFGPTTSPNFHVYALADLDFELYLGGAFTGLVQFGDPTIGPSFVSKWTDEFITYVDGFKDPEEPNGIVHAVAEFGGRIYIGGSFNQIGGSSIVGVAYYDPFSGWQSLGTGVNGSVFSLAVVNGELWVGGQFSMAGGQTALGVAKWSGTGWSSVSSTEDFRATYAITEFNGDAVIGGSWSVPTQQGNLNGIALWDGSSWNRLASGVDGTVYCLEEYFGDLYVGGLFETAGGYPSNNIGLWSPLTPR